MKLIHWIKQTLLLHVPLWIIGLLGVMVLFLPDSAGPPILVVLFFAYFLARHLWRKHLKKIGKLGKASSGLFSLIFWGIIGAVWLYYSVTPDSPRLVLYETSEPNVFDSIDPLPDTGITEEDKNENSDTKLTHKAKKGFLSSVLSNTLESIKGRVFACELIQQRHFIDNCKETNKESKLVELDHDATTVEILITNNHLERCVEGGCNVWLVQTTQAQIDQFHDVLIENHEVGKPRPIAEGTLIDQWENVVTPLIVFNEVSNGWRHIRITDLSGKDVTWKGKSK